MRKCFLRESSHAFMTSHVSFLPLGLLFRAFFCLLRNSMQSFLLDFSKIVHISEWSDWSPRIYSIGCTRNSLSVSCTCKNDQSIVSCISLGSVFQFKYHCPKVSTFVLFFPFKFNNVVYYDKLLYESFFWYAICLFSH